MTFDEQACPQIQNKATQPRPTRQFNDVQTTLMNSLSSILHHSHGPLQRYTPSPSSSCQKDPATFATTSDEVTSLSPSPLAGKCELSHEAEALRYRLPAADLIQLARLLCSLEVLLIPRHLRPACRHHKQGRCRFGSKCIYRHHDREDLIYPHFDETDQNHTRTAAAKPAATKNQSTESIQCRDSASQTFIQGFRQNDLPPDTSPREDSQQQQQFQSRSQSIQHSDSSNATTVEQPEPAHSTNPETTTATLQPSEPSLEPLTAGIAEASTLTQPVTAAPACATASDTSSIKPLEEIMASKDARYGSALTNNHGPIVRQRSTSTASPQIQMSVQRLRDKSISHEPYQPEPPSHVIKNQSRVINEQAPISPVLSACTPIPCSNKFAVLNDEVPNDHSSSQPQWQITEYPARFRTTRPPGAPRLPEPQKCVDCFRLWVLPEDQEAWFAAKQLNPPKRCLKCRDFRKAQKRRKDRKREKTEASDAQITMLPGQSSQGWHDRQTPHQDSFSSDDSFNQQWPPLPKLSPSPPSAHSFEATSAPSLKNEKPLRGRFWESDSSTTSRNSNTPSNARPHRHAGHSSSSYWTSLHSTYDTPSQQEDLFAGCNSTPLCVKEHQDLLSLQSSFSGLPAKTNDDLHALFDHIYFPVHTSVSWCPSATRLSVTPDNIVSSLHEIVTNSLTHPPNPEYAPLQSDMHVPSGQPSSGETISDFPAFYLPDVHSTSRWGDDPDMPDLQSSSESDEQVQDCTDTSGKKECKFSDDALALASTLCTAFSVSSVTSFAALLKDLQLMDRGAELTYTSFVDIFFDKGLTGPGLIRYYKSSHVPHSTVKLLVGVKDSKQYPTLQRIYCHLCSSKLFQEFSNLDDSVLDYIRSLC